MQGSLTALLQNVIQPAETFMQALTSRGSSWLNMPRALMTISQSELLDNFTSTHGLGQVLFVGQNEQDSVTKLVFIQHAIKFVTRNGNTVTIVAIDDKDNTLRVVVVVTPEGTNAVLTTNVPNSEASRLEGDSFNIET